MKDYDSFARTSIGFSHISSGKPCQDFAVSSRNDAASVTVVSDGHGSSNCTRSDRGSRFACEETLNAVTEFLRDVDINDLKNESRRDEVVLQLCKYILLQWNLRVEADEANEPFTEDEVEKVSQKYRSKYLNGESVEHAYGCTLIFVVITQDFCLAVRNGDGQCVMVDRNGTFSTPIPWNNICEFNVTTSLCDQNAIENFRYFYTEDLPAAVFSGSDGVDDSYTTIEELYHLYRSVCLKALDEGTDAAAEYVETLLPELTRRGSADDVSIVALLDPEQLEGARTAMEIAVELRRMELNEARKEQQKRILLRDIKAAEKKKAKAVAQRADIRTSLSNVQENHKTILEQISVFKRKAEDWSEAMQPLMDDEIRLNEMIDEADREIARLQTELLALDEEPEKSCAEISCSSISETGAPIEAPAAETLEWLDFSDHKWTLTECAEEDRSDLGDSDSEKN